VEHYATSLKQLGSVKTVQSFWSYFNNIPASSQLFPRMSYHLMKKGILPLWEDPNNIDGGHISVKIARKDTDRAWLILILAVIGEQFDSITNEEDDICGISVSIRRNESVISLWNSRVDNIDIPKLQCHIFSLLDGIYIQEIAYHVHKQEEHLSKDFDPAKVSASR